MYQIVPEVQPLIRTNLAIAYNRVLEDYREGEVRQEPQITDRFLARIKDSLNEVRESVVRFHAVTFTDRASGSEESRYGADFAGFLRIDYTNRRERKFFLAQAKMGVVDNGVISLARLSIHEINGVITQLQRMLHVTPESYLVIYTPQNFVFIPALSILNTSSAISPKVYWSHLNQYVPATQTVDFFTRYFGCFMGDLNLENKVGFQVDTVEDFRQAMETLQAAPPRRILAFTITVERAYSGGAIENQ